MTFRRHLWAALAALFVFGVLTVVSGTLGVPALVSSGVICLASTGMFLHYRRRSRRRPPEPITPLRDDRVIPQTVKILVASRDEGKCQIKGPPCTGEGEVFDHKWPWSKGGSSKDPDNIQLACKACNLWKSDKVMA